MYKPSTNPDKVAVGLLMLENVGTFGPLTNTHKPEPEAMALPLRVVEDCPHTTTEVIATVGAVAVAEIKYLTSA